MCVTTLKKRAKVTKRNAKAFPSIAADDPFVGKYTTTRPTRRINIVCKA
jgi:hypothetical protein